MKKSIKVLLVSPYSKTKVGGIGTWTKIMLDYCESRSDIELFFQNTGTQLPKRAALNNRLLHIVIGSVDSASIILKLFFNMIRHKPDIVHYTSSAGFGLYKDKIAVFIVRKIFRKDFVIHWRFGRIPELGISKNREWVMLSSVVRSVSASIVIDKRSYETLIGEGLPKVFLTPNPISPQLEALSRQLVEDRCKEREKGTVLFVGHILKTKGIKELIEATKNNPYVSKLIVIGPFFDDSFKEELIKLSEMTDKGANWISWEGELEREKVFEYYQRCAVFCLPSYTEGFPNSVIEAMSFACPILATNVGAIPEMLEDGCGDVVEAKEVDSLKLTLNEMIINTESSINKGEKARSKVLNNYTIDRVYEQYYSIWMKCLQKS